MSTALTAAITATLIAVIAATLGGLAVIAATLGGLAVIAAALGVLAGIAIGYLLRKRFGSVSILLQRLRAWWIDADGRP